MCVSSKIGVYFSSASYQSQTYNLECDNYQLDHSSACTCNACYLLNGASLYFSTCAQQTINQNTAAMISRRNWSWRLIFEYSLIEIPLLPTYFFTTRHSFIFLQPVSVTLLAVKALNVIHLVCVTVSQTFLESSVTCVKTDFSWMIPTMLTDVYLVTAVLVDHYL